MKKKFGQMLCMALAVMMVFTIFAAFPVSAAGDEVWQVKAALAAGNPVEMFDGITIEAAENNSFGKGAKVGDITFAGGIKAGNNAAVTKDSATGEITMKGAAYKIVTERTGKLAIAANLPGNNKSVYVKSASKFDEYIFEHNNSSGADEITFFKFDVQAGETYYFWFGGTKPWVYGATFKEIVSKPANAGQTVTINAQPNEKGLLGNVRTDDEDVELSKSEDMTQSTFTMPDNDVTVYVDFVSKDVQKEVDAVSFDEIKGANTSEKEVYDNLAPFDGWQTSIGYADVSWESSNEEVLSKSGEVNAKSVDTQVTFTAVFSYQDYPNIFLYRHFELTVPADTDDDAAVNAAAEALTLGDTSAVKKNLDLPSKGRRNTSITWVTEDASVVDADGVIYPSETEDKKTVLTALITRGSASVTKEFNITVKMIPGLEINRIAVSNSDGDVVLTPSEGCYVSHIVFTDSQPNKTGDEILVAAVYGADDSEVTSAAVFNIKEACGKPENQNGSETIIHVDKDLLPVYENCRIKVFALGSIESLTPKMAQAAVFDETISGNPVIYVAGDSTACTYPATGSNNRFPQTGWAAVLGDYFDGAKVNDLALSGRSSLDFLGEGNYSTIKNNIKAGDYFIIQFGHNDSKTGDSKRYTDPKGDRFTDGSYKKNITDNYINMALDKGAKPILTTSISRRKTSDSGLEQYVNATKELGKELGLPVVDLYSKVVGYNTKVGVESAKDIYNYVKPHDSRFVNVPGMEFTKSQYYAAGTTDDTHINYFGAQLISQWFCDELERIGHPLTTKRNEHTTAEADVPSYADAQGAAAEAADEPAAEASNVMTVKAVPAAHAAADGEHAVIYEYDDTLGSVEIAVQ